MGGLPTHRTISDAIESLLSSSPNKRKLTMSESGYNGWKNYETWAYALWMDNEESSYNASRAMASEVLAEAADHDNVGSGIWTERQAAVFTLADRLKDEAEEAMPDLQASVWSDLLRSAIQEIDWIEIASNLIEEVADE